MHGMTTAHAPVRLQLADESATQRLGEAIAARLAERPSESLRIWLEGDLGAGKSTLARACLRALGVTGPIKSPTYTLVERYPLGDGSEAWHLDLYRISDPEELDYLGLDEVAVRVWLIEWPERGREELIPPDLRIRLMQTPDRAREALITATNNKTVDIVTKLAEEFH